MSVKEIKDTGRSAFKANYWRCVVAALLLVILIGGAGASVSRNAQDAADTTAQEQAISEAISELPDDARSSLATAVVSASLGVLVVSAVLKIFVFNPLKVGCYRFFSQNAKDSAATLGVVKEGFGGYGHTLVTLLLTDLFVCLWSILFIIPGIIKAYSYRLVPYLIKDEPGLSAMEAIRRSKELMKGNKWKAFVMDLSFIGWFLLGAVTLGLVDVFWTQPYYESARAVFYNDLKA